MRIAIIYLDSPPLACGICHREEAVPPHGGHCLPVYEGKVHWTSKVYVPACRQCYEREVPDPKA